MPAILENVLVAQFTCFLLVLARILAMLSVAPFWGGRATPMKVRVLLSAAIALVATPMCAGSLVRRPTGWLDLATLLFAEAGLGLLFGLGILLLFGAIALAGQILSQLSGLSLAEVFDPSMEAPTPVLTQLLYYVTVAVFFMVGGHRLVMEGLLDTLVTLPPGGTGLPATTTEMLISLLSQSFMLGVRIAAPTMTALLISTVVLGLVSRSTAQLNVLTVGLGLNLLVTFGALLLALGGACWTFADSLPGWIEYLSGSFAATT